MKKETFVETHYTLLAFIDILEAMFPCATLTTITPANQVSNHLIMELSASAL